MTDTGMSITLAQLKEQDRQREAVFQRVIEHRNRLIKAVKGILVNPHGCSLCDSGKPRNPSKWHQPDCPYEIAREALPERPFKEPRP